MSMGTVGKKLINSSSFKSSTKRSSCVSFSLLMNICRRPKQSLTVVWGIRFAANVVELYLKKGDYGPLTKYSFILLCNICTKRATRNSCKVNCRLLESNLLRVRLLKCINHLFRYLHLEMFIKIFRDKI